MLQQEQSPAYKALQDAGLIVNTFRVRTADDLDLERGTITYYKMLECMI